MPQSSNLRQTQHTRYSPAGRSYLPVKAQQRDTVLFTAHEDTVAKTFIRNMYPNTVNICVTLAVCVMTHVPPGRGCWCTAAVKTRGAFPGWWPVGPAAAAPSG